MEYFAEEALKQAILKEKRSFDFYLRAAGSVPDSKTRKMFVLLATEEATHIRSFHSLYSGDELGDVTTLTTPPDSSDQKYRDYIECVDAETRQQQALEISLREEQDCMDYYDALTSSIREPKLHAVFQQAQRDTHNHYQMVKKEYERFLEKSRGDDPLLH